MAEDANRTDPKYDNYLVRFKLEAAAGKIQEISQSKVKFIELSSTPCKSLTHCVP